MPDQNAVRGEVQITEVQPLEVLGQGKRSFYLEIHTDVGVKGFYGPIDADPAIIIDRSLKRHLIGQDAFAQDALWDRIFRADRHSRGSHYLMGLSAIDNALWDLRGRLLGLPVYRLLGGARKQVRAYASCLGLSQEPSALQAKARALQEEGYRHEKWFLRDRGPGYGPEGVAQDAAVVRLLREAVGDDVDLMFDAFWTWDLNYALAWSRRVEPYNPRWIEEAFQSTHLDAFIAFSRATSIPVATGEHFYGRWDVHNFLKAGAIQVVQSDPEWCGGVSELIKMCTLASVYGAHVIPHGHGLHAAMHVVASQPERTCPLVEYLLQFMPTRHWCEKDPPRPVKGMITMPDGPGFDIELDDGVVEDVRPVSWREI